MNHTGLRCWAYLILSECYVLDLSMARNTVSESMVLSLTYLVWLTRFLQSEISWTICLLWSTVASTFAQQVFFFFFFFFFFVASTTLWSSSKLSRISSWITLYCVFIFVAFKAHVEWSNEQCASISTTTNLLCKNRNITKSLLRRQAVSQGQF